MGSAPGTPRGEDPWGHEVRGWDTASGVPPDGALRTCRQEVPLLIPRLGNLPARPGPSSQPQTLEFLEGVKAGRGSGVQKSRVGAKGQPEGTPWWEHVPLPSAQVTGAGEELVLLLERKRGARHPWALGPLILAPREKRRPRVGEEGGRAGVPPGSSTFRGTELPVPAGMQAPYLCPGLPSGGNKLVVSLMGKQARKPLISTRLVPRGPAPGLFPGSGLTTEGPAREELIREETPEERFLAAGTQGWGDKSR